jgi:hypothetical protein
MQELALRAKIRIWAQKSVSFCFVSEKYLFRFGFRFRFQKKYRSVSFRFLKNNVSFRFVSVK